MHIMYKDIEANLYTHSWFPPQILLAINKKTRRIKPIQKAKLAQGEMQLLSSNAGSTNPLDANLSAFTCTV